MKKLLCIIGAIGIGGCSGSVGGPSGSTTSGGGGVLGRALVQSAGDAQISMAARNTALDPATDTLGFVKTQINALGLSSASDDFIALKSTVGLDGLNHVRIQQTHGGVPVFGGDVVVHSNNSVFVGIGGNVLSGLQGLDLTPSVSAASAVSKAKADYARAALNNNPLAFDRESQKLMILPIEGGNARLVWHVQFHTEIQAGIVPTVMNYFIDAHDLSLVDRYNAIHTAVVQASGPGGIMRLPKAWTNELDVENGSGSNVMNTTRLETTNLSGGTSGTGTIFSSSSLSFTDHEGDDAHGYAEVTLNMLQQWQGYNSIDNAGFKILSRVHYSSNYANAFWDGSEMTYGDGDGSQLGEMAGSLDVVAHEIDHGFTSFHSNLTYSGMSGGMNESFSDIAGTTAKFFYAPTTASFNLGGDIFIAPNTYIRWMCKPSTDGSSIDNASQYNSGLDVHYTSGVMNRAFCHASKRFSGKDPTADTDVTATQAAVQKASKAWYAANASYWTASATFTQGCQGVVDAAKALGYSTADITALGDSWKDVGVTCNYGGSGGGGGGGGGGAGGGGGGGGGTGGSGGGGGGGTGGSGGGGGGGSGGSGGGGGGGGGCSHDICTTGGALASS
ncbi:MAG: M4 family metallopeptidase, partial [Polyangia bacterium]